MVAKYDFKIIILLSPMSKMRMRGKMIGNVNIERKINVYN